MDHLQSNKRRFQCSRPAAWNLLHLAFEPLWKQALLELDATLESIKLELKKWVPLSRSFKPLHIVYKDL